MFTNKSVGVNDYCFNHYESGGSKTFISKSYPKVSWNDKTGNDNKKCNIGLDFYLKG